MSGVGSARGAAASADAAARTQTRKPATEDRRFDLAMWVAVLGGQSGPNAMDGAREADRGADASRGTGTWRASEALQSSVVGAPDKPRAPGQGETHGARDAGTSGGAGNVADAAASAGPRAARGADAVPSAHGEEPPVTYGRTPSSASSASVAGSATASSGAVSVSDAVLVTAGAKAAVAVPAEMESIAGVGPAVGARAKGAGASAANPPTPGALARPTLSMPRPAGVFVIPFADGEGTEGRVRLVLRGNSLSATILSSDRETLRRLGESMAELKKALAERGFDDAQLTTRWIRPAEAENASGPPPESPDGRAPHDSGGKGTEQRHDRPSHRPRPAEAFTLQSEVRQP